MVYVALILLGLSLGSFTNALVWRVHEQSHEKTKKKPSKNRLQKLSISQGRSMCPHCKHTLGAYDLIPLVSWLWLRGRCRYCKKTISIQYPVVEAVTALLFIVSYLAWPAKLSPIETIIFAFWIFFVTALMALFVYDMRWKLLPNRIVYPATAIGGAIALTRIVSATHPLRAAIDTLLAVAAGGGIFYVLFQVSKGRWIGGGDVKLGWALGLVAGTGGRSLLLIFVASLLGSFVSLPLIARQRLNRQSTIPFGPFLIIAMVLVQLLGHDILSWYQNMFFAATP